MITTEDVAAAIAECEGTRKPNANTCLKLAALYTIREQMQRENKEPQQNNTGYSFAHQSPTNENAKTVSYNSGSEFGESVYGKDAETVFAVMDELLQTVQVMVPRLYTATIIKLKEL